MAQRLEFWPEHVGGPLWTADGEPVDPAALGLSAELIERLTVWNSEYDDSKLPFEKHDAGWLHRGTELLHQVRAELGPEFIVVVTEPWWGEDPGA